MMYETVRFTGLTLTGDDIFKNRYHDGVIPSSWTRVEIEGKPTSIASNKRWIEQNLTGRYSIYRSLNKMTLFFEEKSSAVLYKLLDGNKAAEEEKITQTIP